MPPLSLLFSGYVVSVCPLLGNAACMLVKVENLLLKGAFPLPNSTTTASYALSLHGFPSSIPEKEREMYVYDEGKRKKEKMAAKSLPKGNHMSCMITVFGCYHEFLDESIILTRLFFVHLVFYFQASPRRLSLRLPSMLSSKVDH